jgi:hypothetical protein
VPLTCAALGLVQLDQFVDVRDVFIGSGKETGWICDEVVGCPRPHSERIVPQLSSGLLGALTLSIGRPVTMCALRESADELAAYPSIAMRR